MYDSRNNCNALIETSTNTLLTGSANTIIPSSITSIGDYAFADCVGLTFANIPNSVTCIGEGAFSGCSSLTSITIPNSVKTIGKWAFQSMNNHHVQSVTCEEETPPALGEEVFLYLNSIYRTIPLYVPAESIDTYKSTDQWKEFNPILAIVSQDIIEKVESNGKNEYISLTKRNNAYF